MERIKFIFSECPFLPVALSIFVLIGAIGVVKNGFIIGIVIGLAAVLVSVGTPLIIGCLVLAGILLRYLEEK